MDVRHRRRAHARLRKRIGGLESQFLYLCLLRCLESRTISIDFNLHIHSPVDDSEEETPDLSRETEAPGRSYAISPWMWVCKRCYRGMLVLFAILLPWRISKAEGILVMLEEPTGGAAALSLDVFVTKQPSTNIHHIGYCGVRDDAKHVQDVSQGRDVSRIARRSLKWRSRERTQRIRRWPCVRCRYNQGQSTGHLQWWESPWPGAREDEWWWSVRSIDWSTYLRRLASNFR